jgi:hypothetical protein
MSKSKVESLISYMNKHKISLKFLDGFSTKCTGASSSETSAAESSTESSEEDSTASTGASDEQKDSKSEGDFAMALALYCEEMLTGVSQNVLIMQLSQQTGIPISAFTNAYIQGSTLHAQVSSEYVSTLNQFFKSSESVTLSGNGKSATFTDMSVGGSSTTSMACSCSELMSMSESTLIEILSEQLGIPADQFLSVTVSESSFEILVTEEYTSTVLEYFSSSETSMSFEGTEVTMSEVKVEESSTTTFTQTSSVDFYSLGVTEEEFISICAEALGIPASAITNLEISADGTMSCDIVESYTWTVKEAYSSGSMELEVNGQTVELTETFEQSVSEVTVESSVDFEAEGITSEMLAVAMAESLGIEESAFLRISINEDGGLDCVIDNEYASIINAAYITGEYTFEVDGTEVTLTPPPAVEVPEGGLEITSSVSAALLSEGYSMEEVEAAVLEAAGVEEFADFSLNPDGTLRIVVNAEDVETVESLLEESSELSITVEGEEITLTPFDPETTKQVQIESSFNLFDIGLEVEQIADIMSELFDVPAEAFYSSVITDKGFVAVIDETAMETFQESFSEGAVEMTVNGATFEVGGSTVGEELEGETSLSDTITYEVEFQTTEGEAYTEEEMLEYADYIKEYIEDIYDIELDGVELTGSEEFSTVGEDGTTTYSGGSMKIEGLSTDTIVSLLENIHADPSIIKGCDECLNFEFAEIDSLIDGTSETAILPGLACFSGDTTVQSIDGVKLMKNLVEGDEVLTVKTVAGKTTEAYQPVRWFIHRDHDTETSFVKLDTESGRSLELSPKHLLPLVQCDDASFARKDYDEVFDESAVFAKRAQSGDCLIVQDNGATRVERIVQVSEKKSTGFYSPVTDSGMIVVDGIHASCYSQIESHKWLRSGFRVMMGLGDLLTQATGTGAYADALQKVDIPAIVTLFQKAASAM